MKLFVTGIGTDVGKTVASAILTEALEADYWKPIQAGDLEFSDTDKVKQWVSNPKTTFHPNAYALQTPASPHYAATVDNINLEAHNIIEPHTSNKNLIIEGAGGLLVPLNDIETVLDLIKPEYQVIVVSRHYLGSINHTLLTIEILKQHNCNILGILFNGEDNPATETIILSKTGLRKIGHIYPEPKIDKAVIAKYAAAFKNQLHP